MDVAGFNQAAQFVTNLLRQRFQLSDRQPFEIFGRFNIGKADVRQGIILTCQLMIPFQNVVCQIPQQFRVLTKRHIFAQPALYPPALIVIASGAFLSKLIAVPEAVNVKRAEINPDPTEIFDQFAVSHMDNLPLLHSFIHVEALLR